MYFIEKCYSKEHSSLIQDQYRRREQDQVFNIVILKAWRIKKSRLHLSDHIDYSNLYFSKYFVGLKKLNFESAEANVELFEQ